MDTRLPSATPARNGGGVGRPLRILVADDDLALRRLHQELLCRVGHHVCMAHSGRELVEQWRLLHPDLVITEAALPDGHALTAAEEAYRDRPAPVILATNSHDPALLCRAAANPFVLACLTDQTAPGGRTGRGGPDSRPSVRAAAWPGEAGGGTAAGAGGAQADRARQGAGDAVHGLGEEQAYQRLRRLASNHNRWLVEIAQAVLSAGEVFQQLEQAGEESKSNGGPACSDRDGDPRRAGRAARYPGRAAARPLAQEAGGKEDHGEGPPW